MIENYLQLYEIFYYTAKIGNITKTAKMLYISQPAITQNIHKLEKILGGTLFVRNKRGVTLTYEGKILFNYISPCIEGLKSAKNKFSQLLNLEIGTINIGCGTALSQTILVPVIKEFNHKYPNININVIHDFNDNLVNHLNYGKIDLMIFNTPYENISGLDIKIFKEVQDCFACSNEYYKTIKFPLLLKDLNNYKLILQQNPSSKRKFLDNFCKEHDVILKPNYELSSMTLVESFIENSLGIGFISKENLNDNIKEVEINYQFPKRKIAYAIKDTSLISNVLAEFLKYLEK